MDTKLLAQECLPSDTLMHVVAEEGWANEIVGLARAGGDVHEVNAHGLSPLHLAARGRHSSACLALLALGADPLQLDYQGRTPLQLAEVARELA